MEEYNMTEIAKMHGVKYIDTFDTIPQEVIDKKAEEGFDFWQIADNNQHICFEFRERQE
jgi:hypothetical protein